jgi:hypothetical protein
MANPKYSMLITVTADGLTTAVTQYTDKATAEAALITAIGQGKNGYLYLEPLPSKTRVLSTASGTWTDAYGVQRYVATGLPVS